MAYSNELLSNHPDDSSNNTKKRVDISEDEGSADLIKDQNKRLKMENVDIAQNKEIYMAIALEDLEKECINPRTKRFYVQPVYVVTKGGVETMDLQEYEKEKEKHSASSSPTSVGADLDLKVDGDVFFSYPNEDMKTMIKSVVNSGRANQELVDKYKAACRQCEEDEREAKRFAEQMKKEAQRVARKAEQDKALVEDLEIREKKGDVDAMLRLASWHEKGIHRLPVDKSKAYMLYKKAADLHEDSKGQEKAGYMLIKGRGAPKDLVGGIDLMLKSTKGKKSSGGAAFYLGYSYYTGKDGFQRDLDKAMELLALVRDQEFDQPPESKDVKQAIKILNELKERRERGYMNPRSSPYRGSHKNT